MKIKKSPASNRGFDTVLLNTISFNKISIYDFAVSFNIKKRV